MLRILKRESGMTFAEILVGMGLLAIVSYASLTVVNLVSQSKVRSQSLDAVMRYRGMVLSSVRSTETLLKTGIFNCLKDRSVCPANSTAYAAFSAANTDGTLVTNIAANAGFNRKAEICPTYPSVACPFRYETQWRSLCDPANPNSCLAPQYKIQGQLKTYTGPGAPIVLQTGANFANLQRFDFEITVGQSAGTYEESCVSVGGVYSSGPPPACALPLVGACPPIGGVPQFVTGYSSVTKTMNCSPLWGNVFNGTGCAAGTVMSGTDPVTGAPICNPLVPITAVTPPWVAQVNPGDPTAQPPVPAFFGGGGGDGGCGAGDGC